VLGRRKMAKHFQISISDDAFGFARNAAAIAAEAALDGIYVVRTNLPIAQSDAATTVHAYKSLSGVEHAFRSMKTVDLELRPVFHWTATGACARAAVHARLLSGMAHAPELGPGCCSTSTIRLDVTRKTARRHTDPAEGAPIPVHSFHILLADLATLTRNVVRLGGDRLTTLLATPPAVQRRALGLIGASLAA
jgi:hypothetical protein